jgi:hypothetical protein
VSQAQPNPSIQSQVIAKVVATLRTPQFPAHHTRMTPFDKEELPAYNVLPDEGASAYTDVTSIDRSFSFHVRHIAQAVDEVDAVVDPLYVAGQKALFADPTLGGLVMILREISSKWELEKGALETVAFVVTYKAEFETSRSDPSQSPL